MVGFFSITTQCFISEKSLSQSFVNVYRIFRVPSHLRCLLAFFVGELARDVYASHFSVCLYVCLFFLSHSAHFFFMESPRTVGLLAKRYAINSCPSTHPCFWFIFFGQIFELGAGLFLGHFLGPQTGSVYSAVPFLQHRRNLHFILQIWCSFCGSEEAK